MSIKRLLFLILLASVTMIVLAFAAWRALGIFSPRQELGRAFLDLSAWQSTGFKTGFSFTVSDPERVTTSILATGQVGFFKEEQLSGQSKFRAVRLAANGERLDQSGEMRWQEPSVFWLLNETGAKDASIWLRRDYPAGWSVSAFLSPWQAAPGEPLWVAGALPSLRELLRQADVFQIRYNGLTELIGGQNTRLIDAELDLAAARAWLAAAERARLGRDLTNLERLAVENLVKRLANSRWRFWIGVRDHRLYRLEVIGLETRPDSRLAYDWKTEFFDQNEPVKISIPARALPASAPGLAGALPSALVTTPSALETSSGLAALPNSTLRADSVNQDPDADGLDNILEVFYGTDPGRADTDGDGLNDGEEVLNGRNPRGQGTLFGFGLD